MNLKSICRLENIPEAFGYKITKKLSQAGIVEITRGAAGGYLLTKDLDELTLLDIILAIEPDFEIRACLSHPCSQNMNGRVCTVHKELVTLQKEVEDLLRAKTMKEILGEE